MNKVKICQKCKGEMEEGVTSSGGLNSGLTEWGETGSVSLWTGKIKNSKKIIVYRCKKCGYLESYAL